MKYWEGNFIRHAEHVELSVCDVSNAISEKLNMELYVCHDTWHCQFHSAPNCVGATGGF